MEKSKIKRIALLVIVITVIFSFIPVAVAHRGKRKVKIRPIEDWLIANNLVDDMPMGYMVDFDRNLAIEPHLIDPSYPPFGYYKPPLTCDYDGFVSERMLKDNRVLVSVNLRVKDAPFYVFIPAESIPSSTPILSGEMDYVYQLRFTIDLTTLGDNDFDENGNIKYMPWWWYVWVTFTLESVLICGRGSGEFVNPYDSWEVGDTAKMNTIHYLVIVGEDYSGSNPNYNLYGLNGITLVDNINLH